MRMFLNPVLEDRCGPLSVMEAKADRPGPVVLLLWELRSGTLALNNNDSLQNRPQMYHWPPITTDH